jgi:hypothetical protein
MKKIWAGEPEPLLECFTPSKKLFPVFDSRMLLSGRPNAQA